MLAGDTPARRQLLREELGQRQQQRCGAATNTAVPGGKYLNAPHFPVFRWLVGVSAANGEPPGEAVKKLQVHSSTRALRSQQLDVSLFLLLVLISSPFSSHFHFKAVVGGPSLCPPPVCYEAIKLVALLVRTAAINKSVYLLMVCPFAGQTVIVLRTVSKIKPKQSNSPAPSPHKNNKKKIPDSFPQKSSS